MCEKPGKKKERTPLMSPEAAQAPAMQEFGDKPAGDKQAEEKTESSMTPEKIEEMKHVMRMRLLIAFVFGLVLMVLLFFAGRMLREHIDSAALGGDLSLYSYAVQASAGGDSFPGPARYG
ncbi:hypothetical protein [Actinobaculum suis]|uniref:hypothetical protein n=1 Tax=Actinobaculum suis TaxID=1657 RepID=UPI0012E22164|nr:hypothetical protein [Actinobaculum suis]